MNLTVKNQSPAFSRDEGSPSHQAKASTRKMQELKLADPIELFLKNPQGKAISPVKFQDKSVVPPPKEVPKEGWPFNLLKLSRKQRYYPSKTLSTFVENVDLENFLMPRACSIFTLLTFSRQVKEQHPRSRLMSMSLLSLSPRRRQSP